MFSPNALVLVVLVFTCASNQGFLKSYSKLYETKTARELLPKVLQSLDKTLDFVEKEYDQVNLDAIFGLRITEALLDSIIKSMTKYHLRIFHRDVAHYLTNLRNKATTVILKTLPNLKISDEKYFRKLGFVVEKKWSFVEPLRSLNTEEAPSDSDRQVTTNIGQSYQPCMVALFGSEGPGYKPCNVTDRCWQVMTRPNNVGYTLTHQVLYFMFGKQRGCWSVLSTKLKQSNFQGGLERLFGEICTSMYHQMLILETIKKLTHQQTDLYFEQSVVCGGLLGYTDFLSLARLERLLRSQQPNGCFGNFDHDTIISRRTTKLLEGGCESHITGVGAALLSTYLRWLLLTKGLNFDPKENTLRNYI